MLHVNNSLLSKGEKVNVSDLDNVMRRMGLALTTEEQKELLKTLPVHGEDLAQPGKLRVMGLYVKTGEIIYVSNKT